MIATMMLLSVLCADVDLNNVNKVENTTDRFENTEETAVVFSDGKSVVCSHNGEQFYAVGSRVLHKDNGVVNRVLFIGHTHNRKKDPSGASMVEKEFSTFAFLDGKRQKVSGTIVCDLEMVNGKMVTSTRIALLIPAGVKESIELKVGGTEIKLTGKGVKALQ